MKINEVNNLINSTLFETVKQTIISEQFEANGNDDSSPSLSCLEGKIVNFDSSQTEKNLEFRIELDEVTVDELKSCFKVGTIEEAHTELVKGLQKDMRKTEIAKSFDIDVDITGDDNTLNIKIKIMSGKLLGENMKTKRENNLYNALTEAKERGIKKIKFENKVIIVEEFWKEVKMDTEIKETDEVEVDECGKKDVAETDIDENDDKKCDHEKEEGEEECSDCGKMKLKLQEKKVLKINEKELTSIIEGIIKESGYVPGVSVTDNVTKEAKKYNDEYISSVDKKMKDYLKIDGNDNPEFPGQIGTGEVEQPQYENTEEDDEYVDNNRGGGMQDLDYDTDPSDAFVERVKKALTGDSTTGNSSDPKETANTIKTDTGEKIMKKVVRKKEAEAKQPMYVKDKQPVVNEETKDKKVINEDIERIKTMFNYNKKTQ